MRTLIETFDPTQMLVPVQAARDARQDAVQWGPNLTVTRGMAMAIKTADSKAYPYAANLSVAPVIALGNISTVAATGAAGGNRFVKITWVAPSGLESAVSNEPTVTVVGANNVLVFTPPAAPAGAVGYNIYVSATTGTETRQNGSTPIAAGVAWTEPVAGLVAGAAMPGGNGTNVADGTQTAKGLAMYSFITDVNGLVFYNNPGSSVGTTGTTPQNAVASLRLGPWMTSPIWKSGIFDPTECSLLDANAFTNLGIRTLHNGFIEIPL